MGGRLGLRLALALVAIGVGGCTSGGPTVTNDSTATTEQIAVDEAATPTIPNEPSAAVQRQIRRYLRPEPIDGLQLEVGVAPALVAPGSYLLTSLGTEVTVEMSNWWRLELEVPGRVDLVPVENALDAPSPRVSLIRPLGYFDDALPPTSSPDVAFPDIDRADWSDWLLSTDRLDIADQGRLSNGGVWFDVVLSTDGSADTDCAPSQCTLLLRAGYAPHILYEGELTRIVVWPDEAGPIMALITGPTASPSFRDQAHELIGSVQVGASKPHPVPADQMASRWADLAEGRWSFAALEDVSLWVDGSGFAHHVPGRVEVFAEDLWLFLVRPVAAADGSPTPSAASVLEALEADPALVMTKAPEQTLWGEVAQVRIIEGGPSSAVLRTEIIPDVDAGLGGWLDHAAAEVWVADTASGPVMIGLAGPSRALVESGRWRIRGWAEGIEFGCVATEDCRANR